MDYGEQHTISLFLNTVRAELMRRGFFEHHLYSTLGYKIENTDTFKLKDGLYMRYNPEPDIWQVGERYDHFFWIGSMFRNEKKLDKTHQYEFTVVDIYLKQGTREHVIKTFLSVLRVLEKKLRLPVLSKVKVKEMTHEEFARAGASKGTYWLVLTDYPIMESFYDTQGKDNGHTSKFEIFFVNKGKPIEIAACGQLGENLNKENYIKGKKKLLTKKLSQKKFIGFGFGVERLARVYGQI